MIRQSPRRRAQADVKQTLSPVRHYVQPPRPRPRSRNSAACSPRRLAAGTAARSPGPARTGPTGRRRRARGPSSLVRPAGAAAIARVCSVRHRCPHVARLPCLRGVQPRISHPIALGRPGVPSPTRSLGADATVMPPDAATAVSDCTINTVTRLPVSPGPKRTPAPGARGPSAPPHGRHSYPPPWACSDRANWSLPSRPGPGRRVRRRGGGEAQKVRVGRGQRGDGALLRLRRRRPRAGCRRGAAALRSSAACSPSSPRRLAAGTAARCPGPGAAPARGRGGWGGWGGWGGVWLCRGVWGACRDSDERGPMGLSAKATAHCSRGRCLPPPRCGQQHGAHGWSSTHPP